MISTLNPIFAGAVAGSHVMSAASVKRPVDMSSISWLVGDWRGPGTMIGDASEARLEVGPALGGEFIHLCLTMGATFEGRAYYRSLDAARWNGHWFDSRGSAFGTQAWVDGLTFNADWGSDQAGRCRTVYRLLDSGSLEITDSIVRREGSFQEFARHLLVKD